MNESNTHNYSTTLDKVNRFLARLPSNVPFVPIVRRPDYQLRRIYLRYRRSQGAIILIALVLLVVFFVYIGGFYYLTHDNVAIYTDPDTGEQSVIWHKDGYASLGKQTLFEGIAAGILMFIGAGGIFMIHQSTKYAYSANIATKYLLGGLALIIIAFACIMLMFNYKVEVL